MSGTNYSKVQSGFWNKIVNSNVARRWQINFTATEDLWGILYLLVRVLLVRDLLVRVLLVRDLLVRVLLVRVLLVQSSPVQSSPRNTVCQYADLWLFRSSVFFSNYAISWTKIHRWNDNRLKTFLHVQFRRGKLQAIPFDRCAYLTITNVEDVHIFNNFT